MNFPNVFTGQLSQTLFKQITSIISTNKYHVNLKKALVHHNDKYTNIYAPTMRKSLKTTFTNDHLTQLMTDYLNTKYKSFNFTFNVIGHQDLLVYKKRDFFKFHRDFKKEFCDDTEIYTLIIGLKCCLKGGRTIIRTTNKKKYYSEPTIPGGLLMFKSTLLHAGEKVYSKLKEVIVFTVHIRRPPQLNNNIKLDEYILKQKYVKYILQKLPYNIEQIICNFVNDHVFLQDKMSPKLEQYIRNNNYIPMQVCISHQKKESTSIPTLDDINIFLCNGVHFMKINKHIYYQSKYKYIYYYNKQFLPTCKSSTNGMYSNLYNKCNLTYYKKNNKRIQINNTDIKFNTCNLDKQLLDYKTNNNYLISQSIKNWFNTWQHHIPLNDEIKKVISHIHYATLMCNGGDDYEYDYEDETTTYTIHSKCFRYGFIVV